MENKIILQPDEFVIDKKLKLQAYLLDDMELGLTALNQSQVKLDEINVQIMTQLEAAIEDGNISPYKATMAHGRLVDSHVKLRKLKLDIYDRLNGTALPYASVNETIEQEEAIDVEPVSVQARREAEGLLVKLLDMRAKGEFNKSNKKEAS